MTRRLNTIMVIQLGLIFTVALALKYHYSTATVNGLKWILAPTTFLVESLTGQRFTFEPYAGYMNGDHTFLIAASCSGVNFLIIAFLMLALGSVWRQRDDGWTPISVAIMIAYAATLIANTARIVIALQLQALDVQIGSLSGEELHRIEGIVVYFGCLLLLFVAHEKFGHTKESVEPRPSTIRGRLKYLLLVYYAITLGIPILRGSYTEPLFWQHAAFVLLIPLILVIPFILASFLKHRFP